MASSEKQRLKHLLVETIHVLCKNSLPDKSLFCIEATIGITLSSDDVMVISFKERVNSDGSHTSLMVTDEQDCDHLQLQPSKKTSDETENHRHISRSRSSCSAGNNNNVPVWKLVSGDATVCQQAEISRTENKSKPTDHNVRMLEDNIIANSGLQSHRAVFGGTDVSSANHCSLPVTDQSYTVSQSSADYEVDSQDDVVIFKVEEAGDIAATASGMQQFDTEVAAPPVQSRSDVTKNKHRLARFDGNMLDNRSSQSTSAFLETNEMQHVDGPRPWMTTFDESFAATTGQLNENNAGAYSSELWSQSKTLWSCNLCGAWLGSSRTLRNHVRKKHMALKTERCRLCGETFRWSGQVARHKRIFHPESL